MVGFVSTPFEKQVKAGVKQCFFRWETALCLHNQLAAFRSQQGCTACYTKKSAFLCDSQWQLVPV